MKVNQFLTSTLAATALLVASCATQKTAQNNSADDVYNTTAQARVYKYSPPAQTAQDTDRNDPYYKSSDPNYDMDYASRIDRFYYGSPNRIYFDDYYNFYGYNSWYNPYSWSLGFNFGWNNWGYNRWANPYYSSWYYYGSPYYWNTWGPYSYYNPWYGGGYYGNGYWGGGYYGGYYGGNVIIRNNENYRPRPNRSNENYRPSGSRNVPIPSRGNAPSNSGRSAQTQGTSGNGNNSSARPTRTSERPSNETYTPPSRPSYTPPPSNSGGNNSGSSGSSSSGSGRPTRGGGRG